VAVKQQASKFAEEAQLEEVRAACVEIAEMRPALGTKG